MTSRPTCPAIPAARWSNSIGKDWAVRAGLFEVPSEPNTDVLALNGKNFGSVVELEERYTPFDQPGKLRIGVFANNGNVANYNQVLAVESANPALDINALTVSLRQAKPEIRILRQRRTADRERHRPVRAR